MTNPAAIITTSWDDGSPLDLRVAEMLREHDLRGTFYVPRSATTGVMSEGQLRDLAQSFEIGAHTLDHVLLTQVPDSRASRQIADSKAWVEDTIGRPCAMFCPPAGRFARRHVAMMGQAGFIGARSVELLSLDPPRQLGGLALLPTTVHAYPHPRAAYVRNALKRCAIDSLWRFIRVGWPNDWEQLAHSLLAQALQTGGVFHLWGHSWELESTAQWDRLARVLRLMATAARDVLRLNNGELSRWALFTSTVAPELCAPGH